MDDCILVHEDKQYLKQCLYKMRAYVNKVYENKTQVTYEVTQTGLDSFSLKDFSAQADAGTGKLMEFIVDSDENRSRNRTVLLQEQAVAV